MTTITFGPTRRVATAALTALLVGVSVVTAVAATADGAHAVVDTSGSALTVRARPTTGSAVVGHRADGARVTITCQTYGQSVTGKLGTSRIWDRLATGGYVSDTFVRTGSDRLVAPPCGRGGSADTTQQPATPGARVRATIDAATAMAGHYPYSWGGGNADGPTAGICCSPSGIDDRRTVGFDCSGLMEYAFFHGAGARLSSTSRSQYADGPRLPVAQLRAGDLVFWSSASRSPSSIHHVALYIGNGRIVEADRVSGPDIRVRSFSTAEPGVMPYVVRPIR